MLNQITIQGRMAKDAEDRLLNNGKAMTTYCVAVQRNYKNANGQYDADFIDCVAFDKTGEFIGRNFHKGDPILVTGELQIRTYDDKNGVKHKVSVINTGKVYFLGDNRKKETQTSNEAPSNNEAPTDSESVDLPFEG